MSDTKSIQVYKVPEIEAGLLPDWITLDTAYTTPKGSVYVCYVLGPVKMSPGDTLVTDGNVIVPMLPHQDPHYYENGLLQEKIEELTLYYGLNKSTGTSFTKLLQKNTKKNINELHYNQ